MTEGQKKQLEAKLWGIANDLRGKMNADEFRDYILGFIFYKYLSERMQIYADKILAPNFDLRQEDTLEHPQHLGMQFEAIVANPPFSAKWSANKIFESDDRFAEYPKPAPRADPDQHVENVGHGAGLR